MKTFLTALALLLLVPANADEFERNSSRELLDKNYQAMHYLERAYEIGRSQLTVSVDCKADEAAAKKAVADKVAAIKNLVDGAAAELQLGEQNQKWGYKLDNAVDTSSSDPVSNTFDAEKKSFFFTNRCTGEQSETPVRAKKVVSASQTVTLWFPNEGQILNSLTALVTKIEGLTEKNADGVRVSCDSAGGTNYDLAVTEATENAAWTEIERVAKERAHAKAKQDLASTNYSQVWETPLATPFQKDAQTSLPRPTVVKENDQWIAKFKDAREFTVFYKQSSQVNAGQLVDEKTYRVEAEATSTDGLYGTLTIAVTKQCADSAVSAEDDVSEVGNTILAQLREINKGANTETDRLEIKDAAGTSYNPLVAYEQISGDKVVKYFYDPCTLKIYEVTKKPAVEAFRGNQLLTISSSDLDALTKLEKDLNAAYALETDDPNEIRVSVGKTFSAQLAVLESLGAQLEREAAEKFLAKGSEFKCDASNFSYACLASPAQYRYEKGFPGGRSLASAESAAAYSEGVSSDVDASERGVKSFQGTYTIRYTVRLVLIDHKRK